MNTYHPTEIRTQSDFVIRQFSDHSDHMAASHFTELAYSRYEKAQSSNTATIPIKHYIGYPAHSLPINVLGDSYNKKVAIFLSYANYDGAVCHSLDECNQRTVYGSYLKRQYQNNN